MFVVNGYLKFNVNLYRFLKISIFLMKNRVNKYYKCIIMIAKSLISARGKIVHLPSYGLWREKTCLRGLKK